MSKIDLTLVVLSKNAYAREWPGARVLVHRQRIGVADDLLRARFIAIRKVQTPFFAFLDDDDDLPADHLAVIEECKRADAAVVYTDEVVQTPDGTYVRCAAPYAQAAHLADPLLVHHLVVCRTADALAVLPSLPRGEHCPELLLYWSLARRSAAYVPRIGYVWNKRPNGMHRWATINFAIAASLRWCQANP